MKVVARRREGFSHEIEIEGGHTVLVDEPVDAGGIDTGPSPARLLAASLAGCVAVTIEMYAERKGWDLGGVEVDVEAEHEGNALRSFEVTLRLPPELSDEQRRRLLVIAGKCPVHKALAHETPVTVSERIESL
ncbi:MAG TPA: OsmC family protein [Solirubrobacterales bacterium]|nr:OsmC family protein [Solirubrobacterales bacterium]